jgi:hypothetical protein
MNIQKVTKLYLVAVVTALGLGTVQTSQAVPYNQCPAIGNNTACAILIEWDGSIFNASVDGSQGPYDNVEDALVGVQNNSQDQTLSYITLSGTNLFGFDGDGINTYGFPVPDASIFPGGYVFTGYEGPISYFSNYTADNGQVNFINGLVPGASTYFALEEAPDTICPNNECGGIVTGGGNGIPEPGTLLLLGAGLAGLGITRRARKNA